MNSNRLTNTKSGYYAGILFLFWPLLALASAFRNYRLNWSKNVLWAFIAFYGFVFAIGIENKGADIVRYVEEYQNLHRVEMTVASAIKYYDQSGEIDVIKTFIAVVLSRFTDSQSILTLLYGIIFGFYFSRNMWFVLERFEGRIKSITLLLFVCFFLIVPIWNMNGFRFWTAAHVFIYGLLPFLFEGKKGGLIITALSILFHFTFLLPVAILFIYILLGNRLTVYFTFFLVTFFISEINLVVFNDFVENYAPEIIQERTAGYRGEEYVEQYREGVEAKGRVWYAVWSGPALRWSVMGFLVILFFRSQTFFSEYKGWLSLFSFTLLFYGIANLFSSLPSGGRFLAVVNLCALALIILYIQNREHEVVMKRFIISALPALLLFVIVSVRMGFYSMSVAALLGNPVIAIFFSGESISLNDVMRLIL